MAKSLSGTIKKYPKTSLYLGIGAIYSYMQGQKATAAYNNGNPNTGGGGTATTPEAWGGFGSQNSRINSFVQNALFWPYAAFVGNAAVNNANTPDDSATMLGAGQTWNTSGS
jgi:hypothetical protein